MLHRIRAFLVAEEGTSAVEYGLMAGLIASALIAMVSLLDGGFAPLFASAAGYH